MADNHQGVASVILYNDKNEILLQKKTSDFVPWPNYWCLFGGHIEPGESPEQAAYREVSEELGFPVDHIDFLVTLPYGDSLAYVYTRKIYFPLSDISLSEGAGFALFGEHEIKGIDVIPVDLEGLLAFWSLSLDS